MPVPHDDALPEGFRLLPGLLTPERRQTLVAELAALPPGWRLESVQPLAVPGLEGDRHLVTITRDPPQAA